jgi:hypothetical protein
MTVARSFGRVAIFYHFVAAALGLLCIAGCSSSPTSLDSGTRMQLVVTGLAQLDPSEGTYTLWVYDANDQPTAVEALHLDAAAADAGATTIPFDLPVANPSRIAITVEPPGDADPAPSSSQILSGAFSGGSAHLTIEGSVTDGRPLEHDPGHHSLFTTSNNVEMGYPSYENAGLWLFSVSVEINKHKTREVKLTPLRPGWTYEGWIVYHQGTPQELWIPYGKFRPDLDGLLTSRDNTGSGVFSGDADYVNAGVEDVPGNEWTSTRVADQLGLHMPGNMPLPLALDAVDPTTGEAIWHHVITIEPAFDFDEPLLTDRPFTLRPYRNAIGAGGPGLPREILYQDNDPTAEVKPIP